MTILEAPGRRPLASPLLADAVTGEVLWAETIAADKIRMPTVAFETLMSVISLERSNHITTNDVKLE
jgi:hypothetical protein